MSYTLSPSINSNKVFILQKSEIEKRWDPNTYHFERRKIIENLKKSNHTLMPLKLVATFSKNLVKEIPENTPYLGLENIESNTGSYIITAEKNSISSAIQFKKGQVLFPKLRPYLNKVHFAKFDGVCSTEFHVLDSKKVSNEYLANFLRTNLVVNQTKYLMSGNTLPRLQTEDIECLLIPILSTEVENEVNALMEIAFKQKQQNEAEAEKLLTSIDDYLLKELGIELPAQINNDLKNRIFTTQLSEVSGSRFDPFYNNPIFSLIDTEINKSTFHLNQFKKVFYSVRGVTFSSKDVVESGLKVLRANNIDLKTNRLLFDDIMNVSSDIVFNEQQMLYKNDILMSAASGSKEHVGKVAYIDTEMDYYFGGFMMVLRLLNKSNSSKYLFEYLQSKIYRLYLFRLLGGTNINNLNFEMIKDLFIPLPPLQKQKEVADHITQIRQQAQQLKDKTKEALAKANREIEKIILGN